MISVSERASQRDHTLRYVRNFTVFAVGVTVSGTFGLATGLVLGQQNAQKPPTIVLPTSSPTPIYIIVPSSSSSPKPVPSYTQRTVVSSPKAAPPPTISAVTGASGG